MHHAIAYAKGRAATSEDDQLLSANNLHDHEPNHVDMEVKKVVQGMKTRAKSETTSIPKIYAETLRTMCDDEEVTATLPTFNSVRTSLFQSRREKYPPMPQSVDDLDFSGEWTVTDKNETFYQGCRDGVFMFTTEGNLRTLSTAEVRIRLFIVTFFACTICLYSHNSCNAYSRKSFFFKVDVLM